MRHLSHEKQIRNEFLGGRILTDSVFQWHDYSLMVFNLSFYQFSDDTNTEEFYDLLSDPHQLHNLAGQGHHYGHPGYEYLNLIHHIRN